MTTTTNSDFARRMMLLAQPAASFRPTATYDPDGDCIEYVAKPDSFYAERIDDRVTVYYSQESGEVVGSLIKGVRQLYKELAGKLPGFQIEIQDGDVRLSHIFLAHMWSQPFEPNEIVTMTYRKLAEVSADAVVHGVERESSV